MEPESKIGQCPRCLIRDDDKTEKKLYRCFLCGEFFCRKHIRPKPCYIVDLKQPDKYPIKWRYLNDDDTGHPDADCRYDDYKINIPLENEGEKPVEKTKEPQESQGSEVSIPIETGEKETISALIKNKKETVTFGTCPKCKCTDSDIIKDYPLKATLQCWNCYLKYGQKKYPPYDYIKIRKPIPHSKPKLQKDNLPIPQTINRKKKNSAKKAIIAGAIIVSLLAIIFFSGALNYVGSQNLTPSPTSPPFTSPISSPATSPFSTPIAPPVTSPPTPQNLLFNPKTMQYHYTLRGVSSELTFTVYGGMYDYLTSHEDSTVSYYAGQQPSPEEIDRIVTLRYVNESVEKSELHNLVSAIEQITPNEDDQARIAVSLVQSIPYDSNGVLTNSIQCKYPYEVLYTNTGVCEQKSMLLVCILRELGYGCSILEFPSQSHAAVGISCPTQYAYYSGYAFVESTSPTIITDCYENYVSSGKLPSSPNYVIIIQDGKVMNSVSEEYQDCQTYRSLINMGSVLDESHYTQWQALVNKYGIPVS